MSNTHRSNGTRMKWYNNTGVDKAINSVIAMANIVGVLLNACASTAWGILELDGEHELAAKTTDTWSQGAALYWDADNGYLTTTSAGNTLAGIAFKAKTNGQVKGWILLVPSVLVAPSDKAVTVAKLADAVQDRILTGAVTAGAEAAHARTITVQLKDAAGNNLAEQRLVRLCVNATASLGAPTATATDTFGAPSAGTIHRTITAKADYEVMTDTDGQYVFEITHNDAGTSRFIDVYADSKPISSAEITFDAVGG